MSPNAKINCSMCFLLHPPCSFPNFPPFLYSLYLLVPTRTYPRHPFFPPTFFFFFETPFEMRVVAAEGIRPERHPNKDIYDEEESCDK